MATRISANFAEDVYEIFNLIGKTTYGETTSGRGSEKLPTTVLRQELLRLAPITLLDQIFTEESYSAETVVERLLEAQQEVNEENGLCASLLDTNHMGCATSDGTGGMIHGSRQLSSILELIDNEGSIHRGQDSCPRATVREEFERLELRVSAVEDSEKQLSSDLNRQIRAFRKQLVRSLA